MPDDARHAYRRGRRHGLALVAVCTAAWWAADLARLRWTTPAMTDRVLLVRLNEIRSAVFFHRPDVAERLEDLILDVERTRNVRLARVAGPDPTRAVRLARGTERER